MDVKLAAATADEGLNVSLFCWEQGISRSTFYKWRNRFLAEGLAGLEERSRRSKTAKPRMRADMEDRIVELRKELEGGGLDSGPASILDRLLEEGWDPIPSQASIWRALTRRGFITPQPQKRPRSSYRSFVFERVNECWQIDHYSWELIDGTPVQVNNIVDDHSRVADSKAFPALTCETAWDAFVQAAAVWGLPGMVLTDNDLVYNGSLHNITVSFQSNLRLLGVVSISSSPRHPQTCGKVERYHQTEQKWLRAHPAKSLEHLNQLLAEFNHYYNHQRHHRALNGATPASIHQSHPKAGPADRPLTTPKRITTGKVTINGTVWSRPWQIAVGSHHAGTPVTTIIDGDQAHIFAGDKLLRHLTLDPNRAYQPLACPR